MWITLLRLRERKLRGPFFYFLLLDTCVCVFCTGHGSLRCYSLVSLKFTFASSAHEICVGFFVCVVFLATLLPLEFGCVCINACTICKKRIFLLVFGRWERIHLSILSLSCFEWQNVLGECVFLVCLWVEKFCFTERGPPRWTVAFGQVIDPLAGLRDISNAPNAKFIDLEQFFLMMHVLYFTLAHSQHPLTSFFIRV